MRRHFFPVYFEQFQLFYEVHAWFRSGTILIGGKWVCKKNRRIGRWHADISKANLLKGVFRLSSLRRPFLVCNFFLLALAIILFSLFFLQPEIDPISLRHWALHVGLHGESDSTIRVCLSPSPN